MPSNSQEKLISFFWRFALVYFFLYITTLTVDYFILEPWFDFVSVPFRWLAEQSGFLFGVNLMGADHFYSDSLLVYVHSFNVVVITFIASALWTFFSKQNFADTKFYPLLFTVLRYFLALNLFIYGFSKIYKWQFMLPEPNILYTRVGDMHRDILYWTSMGSSRSYSIFMGIIEVVPGILLLFRRTTLIAAFVSLLVLANVVAVNFGFDITVKLHSMTLLLMSLVLLIPARKRIAALLTGKAAEDWEYPAFTISQNRKWISPAIKIATITLLLAESQYPYFTTGNFNDDVSTKPPMWGAYEITDRSWFSRDRDGGIYIEDDQNIIERFFINKRGYIIFQYTDAHLESFPLTIDTTNHHLLFDNRTLEYDEENDSTFTFDEPDLWTREIWTTRKVKVEKMPLMQEEFTWIDQD